MAIATETIPELREGDRLSLAEFERRCRASTEIRKAELIEGVVSVTPSVTDFHAEFHSGLHSWLTFYRAGTPHLVSRIDGTVRIDALNQFQPDIHLRIAPGFGGQSRLADDGFVEGMPELIIEVSLSSKGYDLGEKLEVYRRNGARENLVWRVRDRAIDWFVLRQGRFERLAPGGDGLYRSEVFLGLWLDPEALIRDDLGALARAVGLGLATPEHAAFVATLRVAGQIEGG